MFAFFYYFWSWLLLNLLPLASGDVKDSASYALYQKGIHLHYEVNDLVGAFEAYQLSDQAMTKWDLQHIDFTGMYNDLGVLLYNMREYEAAQIAYEKVLAQNPNHFNALANLAALKAVLGDIMGADLLYERGSQLHQVPIEFMHNYGVHALNTGRKHTSIEIFNDILKVSPTFYQSRTEIAKQLCLQDKMNESYENFELAMRDAADVNDLTFFWQIYFQYISSTPVIFPSKEYMLSFRQFYLYNLYEGNILFPKDSIKRPEVNLGCSYLGYYLIYQGFNDIIPRQLYSKLLMQSSGSSIRPVEVQYKQHEDNDDDTLLSHSGKTRIAFLGSFCAPGGPDHSVTLLTKGVIKNINHTKYRVIMLSVAGTIEQYECQKLYEFAEVIILPKFSISPVQCLQRILDLSLHILIYTEIGMVHDTYFLAHSRLALRTLVFWGHAITSGIIDFDRFVDKNSTRSIAEKFDQRGGPDYFISSVLFEKCHETCVDEQSCHHDKRRIMEIGDECYSDAQKKYSERLILQQGLTTYFYYPPAPLKWNEIDDFFPEPRVFDSISAYRLPSLPDKIPFLSFFLSGSQSFEESWRFLNSTIEVYGVSEVDMRLYCIPQTLYKLSPQNIEVIKKVLSADVKGFLVLLDGENDLPAQKQIIMDKMSPSSTDRIIFLRKLKQQEYITLLAISDVVLDTFPVGGGRSSFTIFSTGTPIVMLYPETSILQLTYGMYRTMGIDCAICITYNAHSYVASSVEIATNKSLHAMLRGKILKNKRKLFENRSVIHEWEKMLEYVMSKPRPIPFKETFTVANKTAMLPISNLLSGEMLHTDMVNLLSDLRRIYNYGNFDASFEDWVSSIPFNVRIALSYPYSEAPLRLDRSMESIDSNKTFGALESLGDCTKFLIGDTKSGIDSGGLTLGFILTNNENDFALSPEQKVKYFRHNVLTLESALGLNEKEELPIGNIKDVIVVDDGIVGMSIRDRILFSSSFPRFNFVFQKTQSTNMPDSNKRSWYKLNALSTLLKLAQHRYLLLIPSNARPLIDPFISSPLFESSISNRVRRETPTSFSYMLRFAMELINGYSDVTFDEDGFGLYPNSSQINISHSRIYRQGAHMILLNSLHDSRDSEGLNVMPYRHFDNECEPNKFLNDNFILNGSHLLVEQCRSEGGNYSQRFDELRSSSKQKLSSQYIRAVPSPYCACNLARGEEFLNKTYFGGFVDEDIRDICKQNLKRKQFMSSVDEIIKEPYRDFTCLLALLDEGARKRAHLRNDEVQYLEKIRNLHTLPSLWDVAAMSFVIHGLEKEFIFKENATRVFSRYRNRPVTMKGKGGAQETRKRSLVKKKGNLDVSIHSRSDIVFDLSDSQECKDNPDGVSKHVCDYVNASALNEMGDDLFNCKRKLLHKRFSSHFVQRLLSARIKIGYLSAQLFESDN